MTTQNTYQAHVAATERYERLYWANRAIKALARTQTSDYGHPAAGYPESCVVYDFPARKVQGQNRPRRVVWLASTLPGMRYMGQHERDCLERQRALAPHVTPADVREAKAEMSATRKAMQSSKRQLKLAIA